VQRARRKAAAASPICFPDDLRRGERMKAAVRILVRGEGESRLAATGFAQHLVDQSGEWVGREVKRADGLERTKRGWEIGRKEGSIAQQENYPQGQNDGIAPSIGSVFSNGSNDHKSLRLKERCGRPDSSYRSPAAVSSFNFRPNIIFTMRSDAILQFSLKPVQVSMSTETSWGSVESSSSAPV
jgi:hypothetical protein